MEDSLQQLAEDFREKTSLINSCLELRNLTSESCPSLQTLDETLVALKETLSEIRTEIDQGKQDLLNYQKLRSRILAVKERVEYATANFPQGLAVKKYASIAGKKNLDASKGIPVVTKKNKQPSKIPPITSEEYESVPKYMKGRLPYHSIETFVRTFNKTIAAKYAFLSIPRNQMSEKDLRKHQQFKKQETAETKGAYFCVMEDLKTYASVRPEPSTRAMLTILRHCSRIKEIRGPGSICRYAIREN